MKFLKRNRRGTRVIRVGQSSTQLVGVMLTIVIAAAVGFVGTKVTSEIDQSSDFDTADAQTVTNESYTANFSDTHVRPVNAENDPALEDDDDVFGDFEDNEVVYRTSDGEAQLTEGTDYDWFAHNGTVKLYNTTATQGSDSDPNGTYAVTYNYTDQPTEYGNTSESISGGFTDAMGLTDIIFLILMFGVIMGVLLAFRGRR